MGQIRSAYPNMTLWITEYAIAQSDLPTTQAFFNESAEYFNRLDYVTRYSYFGSFRADVSNVGPNVAMLDKKGKLTQIGSWYLNLPVGASASQANGLRVGRFGKMWMALGIVAATMRVL
jgi:Glycosyl hydrolase catalytic core